MAQTFDWGETPDVEEQTASYFLKGLATLWKLIETERTRILTAAGLLALVTLLGFGIPLLFKELLDYLPELSERGIDQHAVLLLAGMFVVRIITLSLRRFVQEPVFLTAIIRLENHWPRIAHEKLMALSVGFHQRENTGKKIAKVNKGVERLVGMLADIFWQLLPAFFHLFINIPIIFWMDWRLGLIFTLPLIPFVWINLRTYRKFYPHWRKWEKSKEEAVGLFCQSILNIRSIQSFVRERAEAEQHADVRREMRDLDTWICLQLQHYFFAMEMVLWLCFLTTIAVGLYFIAHGMSTVGTVAYIFVTGNGTLQGLWGIIHVYTRMLRHIVSAERMQMLLEEPISVANEAPGVVPDLDAGVLQYEHVTHTYPGKTEPAIAGFDLTVKPGEMLAFVGESGSGKSTLVSLLARVQDPTEGRITIDGNNVRDTIDRDAYRRRFSVVPQDVEIFEGTVRQNITLAHPDASEAWVAEAVKAACLSEIVDDPDRFPDGLETKVGEKGVNLSGGEKQRVSIARAYIALLAGSEVLILDEATSSLDSRSEAVVQEFIEGLRQKQQVTIVAIAHRLSTIQQADRICVLKKGRVAEIGDHARLMQRNGLYSSLVELQNMHEVRE